MGLGFRVCGLGFRVQGSRAGPRCAHVMREGVSEGVSESESERERARGREGERARGREGERARGKREVGRDPKTARVLHGKRARCFDLACHSRLKPIGKELSAGGVCHV